MGRLHVVDTALTADEVSLPKPISARGGKRPRTTSAIFAAAATGMLVDHKLTETPTARRATQSGHIQHHEHEPDELFRLLRREVHSGRVRAPPANTDTTAKSTSERVIARGSVPADAVPTTGAQIVTRTKRGDKMDPDPYSFIPEDTSREAEAMEADEGRLSPPSPPPERSRGYPHRQKERRRASFHQNTAIGDMDTTDAECSGYEAQRHFDGRRGGASSGTAPAYEPLPLNACYTTYQSGERDRSMQTRHQKQQQQQQQQEQHHHQQQQQHQHWQHDERAKFTMGLKPQYVGTSSGFSSTRGTTNIPTEAQAHHKESQIHLQLGKDENSLRHNSGAHVPVSSEPGEEKLPSSRVDRTIFLSTVKKSDEAYKNVRDDLQQYMERMRARTSEDGTPSVTFPRNFEHVVGLMGRSDLEDRFPEQESKREPSSYRLTRKGGDDSKGDGKGLRKGDDNEERPPPWTKYLLEEGLDRTKTFSRYKGMFADEQTGQDRFMRGLAKMRELDLRLARTTERARELKLLAQEAAERATTGISTVTAEQTGPCPKGRGPLAVEDVSNNRPALALPLPLYSKPSAFGPVSSRVSSRGTQQKDSGSDRATALRSGRSEMSTASGSPCGGSGDGSSLDDRAREGRAFVTQNFRGARRKESLSNTGLSSRVAADGNKSGHLSPADSRRDKNSFDSRGSRTRKGDSSTTSAGESGGSSGVSFVLKNKEQAARAWRRRLTDEQESLVSRFLEDADGFNDEGELTGEGPSGVWAEITPYGGAGASLDMARLADINNKLLAICGKVLPDSDEEDSKESTDAQEKNLPPLPTGAPNEVEGVQHDNEGNTPPTPPPPTSLARGATITTKVEDIATPGEAALREQRARREARKRERAIDTALEQLRETLFEESAAGRQSVREKAVDTALELARSAPLNMQKGVRRGAGRIESLLGGGGPQPVGDWEVRHALKESEEALRGKELASQESIEKLLATVRQVSVDINSEPLEGPKRHKDDALDPDHFPEGASLDAFFSLTDEGERRDVDSGSSGCPPGNVTPTLTVGAVADTVTGRSDLGNGPSRGGNNYAESAVGEGEASQEADRGLSDGDITSASRPREQPSPIEKTERIVLVASKTADSGSSSALLPRPKLLTKKKAAPAVSPELAALFRAPLLLPRHLDPPIAGSAAAAVAAGGSRRIKTGARDAVVG